MAKRIHLASVLVAFGITGLCPSNASAQLEQETDRAGLDYRDFDMNAASRPEDCEAICRQEARCRAFTYVRAGVQGAAPRCWLKEGVPEPRRNACCVSGVKRVDLPGRGEGCYQVVLTGFTANHETADNILEHDGKRDEIFITNDTWLMNAGTLVDSQHVVSEVMGDTNNQADTRVQAGGASDFGGIQSGDSVPPREPWRLVRQPRANQVPMLLWRGELRAQGATVVIMPTVWEWDDGGGDLRDRWSEYLRGPDFPPAATPTPAERAGRLDIVRTPQRPFILSSRAGDRPIGFTATPEGTHEFFPSMLVLNYEFATRAAARDFRGRGDGILELSYQEPEQDVLDGHYTLYIRIAYCGN